MYIYSFFFQNKKIHYYKGNSKFLIFFSYILFYQNFLKLVFGDDQLHNDCRKTYDEINAIFSPFNENYSEKYNNKKLFNILHVK